MQSAQGERALGLGFIRVLSGLSERRKKAQKRVVGLESPHLLPCRCDFLQYLLLRS
jgi:hypothetical protein